MFKVGFYLLLLLFTNFYSCFFESGSHLLLILIFVGKLAIVPRMFLDGGEIYTSFRIRIEELLN